MMVQASGWQSYKRLLSYLKPYWRFFALGVVGFILNAQTEWAGAQLIKFVINAIQEKNQADKNLFPLLVIGIFFFRGIGTFMGNYYLSLVARNVVYTLRKELFAKLLVLPNHYICIRRPFKRKVDLLGCSKPSASIISSADFNKARAKSP